MNFFRDTTESKPIYKISFENEAERESVLYTLYHIKQQLNLSKEDTIDDFLQQQMVNETEIALEADEIPILLSYLFEMGILLSEKLSTVEEILKKSMQLQKETSEQCAELASLLNQMDGNGSNA